MKKIIFIVVLCITCILSVNYLKQSDIVQTAKISTSTKSFANDTVNTTSTRKELAFDFNIETSVRSDSNKVLSQSVFSGKLLLAAQSGTRSWLGKIIDAELVQQGSLKKLDSPVFFKTDYTNLVFEHIDLLGLNEKHPVNAIRFVLPQLSYKLNDTLLIDTAINTTSYKYAKDGNEIRRKITHREYKNTGLTMLVTDVKEQWQLITNQNNFPVQLNTHTDTHYESQTEQMVMRQAIKISPADISTLWDKNQYTQLANANLKYEIATLNSVLEINSKEALNDALQKLASFHDETLAHAIGKYLIANYSSEEIAKLIKLQGDSRKASLIIYSIQKNPDFAAEVILVDLIADPELDLLNKQRVVMSLGRFEAVSDLSLNSLKNLVQQPETGLANTAELSIGTIAQYNVDKKSEVIGYLSSQLSSTAHPEVTLLAINNTGMTDLNDQAVSLLGNQSQNVNMALIKLLSKEESYHDQLVDFTIHSNQLKTIGALAKALSEKKLILTQDQKQQIVRQVDKASNELLKAQLTALLNTEKHQW